ncbi:MAG: 50S ribosomal protein L32e [Candidatus Thermoplasmatota archaeon]
MNKKVKLRKLKEEMKEEVEKVKRAEQEIEELEDELKELDKEAKKDIEKAKKLREEIEEEEEKIEEEIEEIEEEEEKIEEKPTVKIKKIKPKIKNKYLEVREKINKRRPAFKRQEWFRYKKLGEKWRKPKGIHSKMRKHKKYRPPIVSIGYRGPKEVRGIHPSGFEEVLVYNTKDIEKLNPERQAARIGRTVGLKKKLEIEKKAVELNLRILNPGR